MPKPDKTTHYILEESPAVILECSCGWTGVGKAGDKCPSCSTSVKEPVEHPKTK